MSASRPLAVTALVAVLLGAGCAAPPPPRPAPRATPPSTAYAGAIVATPDVYSPPLVVSDVREFVHSVSLPQATAGTSTSAGTAPAMAASVAVRPPPRAAGRARVVDRAQTAERRVALTFDAGADRGYAEQILDTLRESGVHASFGMTGQWAESNPDLLRRMVADGHHLINHTQTHDSFTGLSTGRPPKPSDVRVRELAMAEQAVQRIAGVSMKPYFRPPYGDLDTSVSEDVYAQGYDVVAMWTVDSQGWNGLSRAGIEARCLRLAAPGAVYVLHVGSAAQDGPALPGIIQGLREKGYEIGSLDWLLRQ